MSRPEIITPEVAVEVGAAIAVGCQITEVAKAVGVTSDAIYKAIERGRSRHAPTYLQEMARCADIIKWARSSRIEVIKQAKHGSEVLA